MPEAPQQPNDRDFKTFDKYSTLNDSSGLYCRTLEDLSGSLGLPPCTLKLT